MQCPLFIVHRSEPGTKELLLLARHGPTRGVITSLMRRPIITYMKIVMEINLENTPWCSGKLGQVHENLCVCVYGQFFMTNPNMLTKNE